MSGTYTQLVYHIVFSTKNRYNLIVPSLEESLYRYIGGIIRQLDGVCLEINGMSDHVHLLTRLPPKVALSDTLREIKANSSKWVNASHGGLHKFGWQDGYAAFSVSKSKIESVRGYVRGQKTHHTRTDFRTEFARLLRNHDVAYDERYIWN